MDENGDPVCLALGYFCCCDATLALILGFVLVFAAIVLLCIPGVGVVIAIVVGAVALCLLIDGFCTCFGASWCIGQGKPKNRRGRTVSVEMGGASV